MMMTSYDKNCVCSSCEAHRENDRIAKLAKMDKQMNYNKLMTRKEAVSKCHGMEYPEVFIQALEALGLMKFKPEEPVERGLPIGFDFPFNKRSEWYAFAEALNNQGFVIVQCSK